MTRCAVRILALGLTIAVPRHVDAQADTRDPRVHALAGCYTISSMRWADALTTARPSDAQTPPRTFQLDTIAVPPQRGSGFVVVPTNLVPSPRPLTSWRPLANDSVRITWSTGFVGVGLRLRVSGDTLTGHARAFHDAHGTGEPPDPTAEIVAHRVRCML